MEKLTNKNVVARLVTLYREIDVLNSDIRMLKDEAKEVGLNHILLAKVAKLIASDKTGKFAEDSRNVLELLEEVE